MQILNSIRERFSGRQRDAETRYAGLVASSANGKDSDFDVLGSVLSLTNRTMEDFIADVEKIERRGAARLKLKEAERLRPACEAALTVAREALDNVEDVRAKATKLIDEALEAAWEKSNTSGSLQRRITELERTAHEDLMATADPIVKAQIDQLEARLRSMRSEQNTVGRSYGCDPTEAMMAHRKFSAEATIMNDRLDALRQQQLA